MEKHGSAQMSLKKEKQPSSLNKTAPISPDDATPQKAANDLQRRRQNLEKRRSISRKLSLFVDKEETENSHIIIEDQEQENIGTPS